MYKPNQFMLIINRIQIVKVEFDCFWEKQVLIKQMCDYLTKRKIIKARKSGTYSRLLQRYRKKWQLSRNSNLDPSEEVERPDDFLPEIQNNAIPETVPPNDAEYLPDISNEDQPMSEIRKHKYILHCSNFQYINCSAGHEDLPERVPTNNAEDLQDISNEDQSMSENCKLNRTLHCYN